MFLNGVTFPRVFSYPCVLPVGFHFKLTYELKPQAISAIKIVNVYRRSIFHVEWLIATMINLFAYLELESCKMKSLNMRSRK